MLYPEEPTEENVTWTTVFFKKNKIKKIIKKILTCNLKVVAAFFYMKYPAMVSAACSMEKNLLMSAFLT